MILSITCASEVIMLPNKKVKSLFLTISTITEISQKVHFTRTLNFTRAEPPVQCMSQILTTFNMYSGRAMVGLYIHGKDK